MNGFCPRCGNEAEMPNPRYWRCEKCDLIFPVKLWTRRAVLRQLRQAMQEAQS